MPRREILNEIYLIEQIEKVGGFTRKSKWVGVRGAPDRFCGFPRHGRSAWVEVKELVQDWGLQAHQDREHNRLRACGQEVWVVSTQLEIDQFIREMTR